MWGMRKINGRPVTHIETKLGFGALPEKFAPGQVSL